MAQTTTVKNMTKTLASAAIGGMLVGSAGFIAGCQHDMGSSAPAAAAAQHACKGQNACKGQGSCKTTDHACKGQNSCKGQGGCKSA